MMKFLLRVLVFVSCALAARAGVVVPTDGFGCDANGRSDLYTNTVVSWGDLHSHTSYSDDAAVRQACTRSPLAAIAYSAS
ncbi:MAG: hypothetical protein V2A34_12755, partial [Lentisphaerota bacterium]